MRSVRTTLLASLVVLAPVASVASVASLASGLVACGDPVHDDAVSALGPEAPGERPGPTHRHGQPCLVCHGGSGPGKPEFSIGGTVYAVKGQPQTIEGATVHLVDSRNEKRDVNTNAAGNFYIEASAWVPVGPINVTVSLGAISIPMGTHIGRDGSCASCHAEPASTSTVGHVYVATSAADLPGGTAP